MSTAIDEAKASARSSTPVAAPCSTTCTCKAAMQARNGMTLLLAFAVLALALSTVLRNQPGFAVLLAAGAYLLQIWHDASPPAAEDWWKRPRAWLGILAVGIGVTALVIGVAGGFARFGE